MRAFLGLAEYYRRFVKPYATITAPPTSLLRKDAFLWTPEVTTAFNNIKQALMTTLVLGLPDFQVPFVILTDASNTDVGAILTQHRRPLAYFSKQLFPRMSAALTYAREMYAIT